MFKIGHRALMLVAISCAFFVTWKEGYLAGYRDHISDLKANSAPAMEMSAEEAYDKFITLKPEA
ncbi:hypothetical protein [Rubinisphaera sp.]|uniref:hypothetical protein n=1 Tax=Rubinisphaera sp. TaxID=2024857 RepID=UPI000C0E3F11|nr:hypothetical protein [Rubinisphaera sp.]MBV08892.1 hypothetical protein [Rubinisphaera sp.]HCS50712.1 hypothetical protein [Planctomycetaceae bacterium]|tara:strand:- start:707 stop:898 length:192 start_codon:yes stop_codon:yes gene_type:complete